MAAAYEAGLFDGLVTPFLELERDNSLRPAVDPEKLATLKPVFDREHGTLTAANSDRSRTAERARRVAGGGSSVRGDRRRVLAHLAAILDRRGSRRGLISICAAGGQGVVAVVEK